MCTCAVSFCNMTVSVCVCLIKWKRETPCAHYSRVPCTTPSLSAETNARACIDNTVKQMKHHLHSNTRTSVRFAVYSLWWVAHCFWITMHWPSEIHVANVANVCVCVLCLCITLTCIFVFCMILQI